MYTLVDFSNYSNELFIISSRDPKYIKLMKIKLLLKRYDEISADEIQREIYIGDLNVEVLDQCLKQNIVVDNIFDKMEFEHHSDLAFSNISINWSKVVSEYLYKLKEVSHPGLFLEVSGKVCEMIPGLVFKIDSDAYWRELIRFFCMMLHREKITKEQCINYLKGMRTSQKRRINLIIDNIERVNPDEACIVEHVKYSQKSLLHWILK